MASTAFKDNEKAGIDKIYKPTTKESDIRKHVYRRYHEMKNSDARQRAEKEWQHGEASWEAIRKSEGDEWQSNYIVPLTTAVVESVISEITDQNTRPLILPRGREDDIAAKVMSHALDFNFEVSDFDEVRNMIVRSGVIRGTGFAQEMYLKDRRKVRDILGVSEKNKKKYSGGKRKILTGEEEEVLEYDDLYTEYVSNWDLFWDETALEFNRGTKKCRDVIRRYLLNEEEFKDFFSGPVWNHLNNARFVRPGKATDYYRYYQPGTENDDHKNQVEVLWYWSRRPEDSLVVMANDVVIRMGPNIYKHKWMPFAKSVDVKRLDRFCGKGEPALLESIQEEVDTMRRMVIDRNHLDIDKMFVVSNTSMLNDDDLIARPHGAISADDPNSIKPLEYNDIPLSVERTFKAINEDSIRVTGIDDRFQSLAKTPSTATEAAILKESTLKRIKMKISNLEKGLMMDVGRMKVANILQFYSQPKLEKIVGDKKSNEYKAKLGKLMNQGMVEVHDGEFYEKKYRDIRTNGIELNFDEKGRVIERKRPGYHFFTIKPEFFTPVVQGGFDIRFDAGASLPVSKPLQQSKTSEMFDRLLPLTEVTNYDPEKLADKLVEVNDMNPQDFKSEAALEEEEMTQNRVELAMELAGNENQAVLEGEAIPPNGTPYAPAAHTQIHIEFLKSPQMKMADDESYMRLLVHTQGEVKAIQQRGGEQMGTVMAGGPAQPGQAQPFPANTPAPANAGGMGQGAQNTIPALVQGGNQVPTGRAIGNG